MSAVIVLSDSEKAIFDAIQKAAENSETTPTLDTLRLAAGCGRDRAGDLVRSLADKGLIRIGGDGSNYRTYYITGTYHSTVKAERHGPEFVITKPEELDATNKSFLKAICRYHIGQGRDWWRRNLNALGRLV